LLVVHRSVTLALSIAIPNKRREKEKRAEGSVRHKAKKARGGDMEPKSSGPRRRKGGGNMPQLFLESRGFYENRTGRMSRG